MTMDRFNSNEESENVYNHPIFLEGIKARKEGKTTFDNPYSRNIGTSIIDLRKKNLWTMGWCDQDMIILQEVTIMFEKGQHYFVGGSIDSHPELCDVCGKIYSDSCHIPRQEQPKPLKHIENIKTLKPVVSQYLPAQPYIGVEAHEKVYSSKI